MAVDPLTQLIHELGKLPGIGARTATRLAFHILQSPTSYAESLAEALMEVKRSLGYCSICANLTSADPCAICKDSRRGDKQILVVALPQDLMAIERTGNFRGRYHVLHGLLAPLDGVGPDDLKIKSLLHRLKDPELEIILATSPNVEGDATALYLASLIKPLGFRVSRIASGVPIGSELEYADGVTINRAIEERRTV
jgi:recombination protein RecR